MGKNKSKLIDSIMHFIVHNGFTFTVAVMGLVHVTLLGIMVWAGIPNMIYANTVSVAVYLISLILCKLGKILPVYINILVEVTAYTIYSVYIIGWASSSVCFLFSIVPIIIYFGCFLFKGWKRLIVVFLLAVIFSVYVVLYILFSPVKPPFTLPRHIHIVLVIFSAFVMFFSMIFYNALYIYSSEVEMFSLERKNEQLSADAHLDALTNLLNRRGFLPVVEKLMSDKKKHHFCVAFCDIDDFKHINDSYGHEGGDEVLRHITGLIRKDMNDCDICRWGGEEIVILMKDYDMEDAKEKMEYVRKLVESNPTIFYNKHISATITIGVEEIKESYSEPEAIIKAADERMYYGKQHGKNVVIFEDMEQ